MSAARKKPTTPPPAPSAPAPAPVVDVHGTPSDEVATAHSAVLARMPQARCKMPDCPACVRDREAVTNLITAVRAEEAWARGEVDAPKDPA